MSVTSGTQPPQPVPALVHFFSSPLSTIPLSLIAEQICPLLTLLHEQIWQSSAISPAPPRFAPPPDPTINSPGFTGSVVWHFAMTESCPYSLASPTRTPPSSLVPSGLKSSFL